jgi:glycosyltransferase involved in cell wall biosynthesis
MILVIAIPYFDLERVMNKPCVVIPVFDHEHAIDTVVTAVLAHNLPCILVDDGSSLSCAKKLDELVAEKQNLKLLRLTVNSGKGAAVLAGIKLASQEGYTHVLQIDADGQHCTDDIPQFVAEAQKNPESIINGRPIYDASIPKVRLYARYLTHIWVWINTWSFQIIDSMCGFRVYPIASVMKLIAHQKIGHRMNFDTDILVRLYWEGLDVINVPTRVTYPSDGVSHFRMWLDNALITRMHVILFFGMVWRIPTLLARKVRAR